MKIDRQTYASHYGPTTGDCIRLADTDLVIAIERVAAKAFDLDPARLTVAPLDGLDLPQLRVPMLAVGAELTAGAGGPLAAESLATFLAVNLIRHALTPRQPARRRDGTLPQQGKTRFQAHAPAR